MGTFSSSSSFCVGCWHSGANRGNITQSAHTCWNIKEGANTKINDEELVREWRDEGSHWRNEVPEHEKLWTLLEMQRIDTEFQAMSPIIICSIRPMNRWFLMIHVPICVPTFFDVFQFKRQDLHSIHPERKREILVHFQTFRKRERHKERTVTICSFFLFRFGHEMLNVPLCGKMDDSSGMVCLDNRKYGTQTERAALENLQFLAQMFIIPNNSLSLTLIAFSLPSMTPRDSSISNMCICICLRSMNMSNTHSILYSFPFHIPIYAYWLDNKQGATFVRGDTISFNGKMIIKGFDFHLVSFYERQTSLPSTHKYTVPISAVRFLYIRYTILHLTDGTLCRIIESKGVKRNEHNCKPLKRTNIAVGTLNEWIALTNMLDLNEA